MEFKVEGKYPVLRVFLNKDEEINTTSGNMSWMTSGIKYNVHSGGGFKKSIGRMFAGEGLFQNTYKAVEDNQEISFAMSMPGEIKHIELDGSKKYIAQKDAFLASEKTVEFNTVFTKKFSAGLLGGEGFILQEFSGTGHLFLEADGSLIEYNLEDGESMLVDQGNVFLFEESIKYEIETIKGTTNKLFGGEGFFLVRLTGPGKIILQTLPISSLSGEISKFIPRSN